MNNITNTGEETRLRPTSDLEDMLKGAVQTMVGDVFDINTLESNLTELFMILRKKVTEEIFHQIDVEHMECKECGNKMKNKGKKHRKIKGLVDYDIHVRVFYCDKCERYERPLDKIIGNTGRITLEVKEAMVLLGQRIPFEEASSYMEKLLKVGISHESIQELLEGIGEKISKEEEELIADEIDANGYVKDWKDGKPINDIAYMELDGSMVQTREDDWKEVRVGVIFAEKDRLEVDKNHNELYRKKYFSVFNDDKNSLAEFKNRATLEAYNFGFHNYVKHVIVGDGAPWIWDYASTYHPGAIQVLDYYHASEYLCNAINAVQLKDEGQSKQLKDWLWEGKIEEIIKSLEKVPKCKEIEDCLRYYRKNSSRMKYGEYRKEGVDIGSGVIESAHRVVVQVRMKQSGMHWNKKNVQPIVSLRALYLSGRWSNIVTHLKDAA
uniref:ISKra4 family transposase n=2 Tax=uncultured Nitrospirae bacterium MY2-3C TaxID=798577 RepID=D9MNZ9_9BACT|nr:unknown protein [uncultured Nitrospirae bacterium MY2-3C]